ncbi:Voltage-gated Ion Channel (VIC) Superfamily [Achlya hypogyna]|uniref:Voltage-gated Ion Channel (VIC) Superfamily n=1 Tax=Achlya hypogyna TaxID=1202772 RepID=A0A1V9Z8N2_ACHHY|nr:Voltage-gated Ion Channel (VIC) Superfamily [Achlya hypogyna]
MAASALDTARISGAFLGSTRGPRTNLNKTAVEVVEEIAVMQTNDFSTMAVQQKARALDPDGVVKQRWDCVVLATALIFCVAMPLNMCFGDLLFANSVLLTVVDIILAADVAIAFFTARLHPVSRSLVVDPRAIAKLYVCSGDFWVDIISSIPTAFMDDSSLKKTLQALRCVMFLRISWLANATVFSTFAIRLSLLIPTAALRLFKLAIGYWCLHHYLGCIYYQIVLYEGNATTTWVVPFTTSDSVGDQYLGAMYMAFFITSGSSVRTHTMAETVFTTTTLAIGMFANACIFGIGTNLFQQLQQAQDTEAYHRECVGQFLEQADVDDSIHSSIMAFYSSPLAIAEPQRAQASTALQDLPDRLGFQLQYHLHHATLAKATFFRLLSQEQVLALLLVLKEVLVVPGELIVKAGEPAHAFYLIERGTIELVDPVTHIVLGELEPGEFFGEIGLLHNTASSLNVVAASYCKLHVLYKVDFLALMGWDVALAVCTTYYVLLLPLDLCFLLTTTEPVMQFLQVIVDVSFILEVLLLFRTSILDPMTRDDIVEPMAIAASYCRGWLVTDLLSALPTSLLPASDLATTAHLVKLVRVTVVCRALRLSKALVFEKCMLWLSRRVHPSSLRLSKLVSMYLLLHHYLACLYYLMTVVEQEYYGDAEVELWDPLFDTNDSRVDKYVASFFQAATVMGAYTLRPKTSVERLFTAFGLVVAIVANSCLFGVVATLLEARSRLEDEHYNHLVTISKHMQECHIDDDIQRQVLEFYDSAWAIENAHHADVTLSTLPDKLELSLRYHVHANFVQQVPFLRCLEPESILELLTSMEDVVVLKDDLVVRAGEPPRAFYLIDAGIVEAYEVFHDGSTVVLSTLHAGHFFGEVSLITNEPTTANIRALTFCRLKVLSKATFDDITKENTTLRAYLRQCKNLRLNKSARFKVNHTGRNIWL